MKLKELTITRGATINLGDFESARVDITAAVIVGDDEDFSTVFQTLDETVRNQLVDEAARLKGNARGKSPRRFVEGA